MTTVLITRPTSDLYTQSYDVWAQINRYPLQEGDGQYVGNAEIGPNDTSTSIDYTEPTTSGTWKYIAIPIRFEMRGVPVKATAV